MRAAETFCRCLVGLAGRFCGSALVRPGSALVLPWFYPVRNRAYRAELGLAKKCAPALALPLPCSPCPSFRLQLFPELPARVALDCIYPEAVLFPLAKTELLEQVEALVVDAVGVAGAGADGAFASRGGGHRRSGQPDGHYGGGHTGGGATRRRGGCCDERGAGAGAGSGLVTPPPGPGREKKNQHTPPARPAREKKINTRPRAPAGRLGRGVC